MNLSYDNLLHLRKSHPAWRLLTANSAPLIASFLHHAFLLPNARIYPMAELAAKLDDELYRLREANPEAVFPLSGEEYLNQWAEDDAGWLRKFYPSGDDEPHFDLTPATEKAINWLMSLVQRSFVGTESRLLTVFLLLQEIVEGTQRAPEQRIETLKKRITDYEEEIRRLEEGHVPVLDDTAVKERFAQMSNTARELLSDFREVQDNFRRLDRHSRERIAQWDGTRGELLDEILGERDAITNSDQGRSFQAFWEFLMSQTRQEELTGLLEKAFELPAVASTQPDRRLRKIHYDWLAAGEETQRTVSTLSEQLRRFLDDKAWLENKRIVELLKKIERHAIAVKEHPPRGEFTKIDPTSADIQLVFERPLFSPPLKLDLKNEALQVSQEEVDTSALFEHQYVDRQLLTDRILRKLSSTPQITLSTLVEEYPLEKGLAELVAYMALKDNRFSLEFHEDAPERIIWTDREGKQRRATLPRVVFVR